MDKWADYCISEKRMNATGTHIDQVKVHPDNGDQLGVGTEWSRNQVIASLKLGKTFITVYKSDGKYKQGREVRIIHVNGVEYIRTDANAKAADNLDNLPDF